MLFVWMVVISAAIYLLSYKYYGAFMSRIYGLNNDNIPPSIRLRDDIDYCPTHPAVLLGHHFSSIAGAGPITGPIAATLAFGWLPTLIWCIIGSSFLGGPHDMGALVASMRHDGKSVGEVVERWIGHTGKILFLCFTILALILVVAVFLVLSAGTFVADPVVAFVSSLYIVLAIISGIMIYRFRTPLWVVTVLMLGIISSACIYVTPESFFIKAFTHDVNVWNAVLAVYIFFASVLPVWLLLQPRDYLASYFLYFAVIVGAIGMLFGGHLNSGTIEAMAGNIQYFDTGLTGKAMWPMMFVIVACGAISGFHALVGSGTTSKQIRCETDAKSVGYGAMLIEGMVAVIAIGTLMVLGRENSAGLNPVVIFSKGFGKFSTLVGIDEVLGARLGAIAINSFLLTSLDTATRLVRYQIQELSNMRIHKYVATCIAVGMALLLVYTKTHSADGKVIAAWQAIWPVFGASNQLVAALTLLGLGAWVHKGLKKSSTFMMIPFWFMLLTTMCALVIMVKQNLLDAAVPNYLLGSFSIILLVLSLGMVINGLKAFNQPAKS